MVVLMIFPVILQTVISLIMLSIGGQGQAAEKESKRPSTRERASYQQCIMTMAAGYDGLLC